MKTILSLGLLFLVGCASAPAPLSTVQEQKPNLDFLRRPTTYEERKNELVYDDMYDERGEKKAFKPLGDELSDGKLDWIYLFSYQRCPIHPLPNEKTEVKASVRRGRTVKVLPHNKRWVRIPEGFIHERCFRPKERKRRAAK